MNTVNQTQNQITYENPEYIDILLFEIIKNAASNPTIENITMALEAGQRYTEYLDFLQDEIIGSRNDQH